VADVGCWCRPLVIEPYHADVGFQLPRHLLTSGRRHPDLHLLPGFAFIHGWKIDIWIQKFIYGFYICTIADKRNGTPLGFAHFKIGTFFLIKGGKTQQVFLTCSFDDYLYFVENSGQYLTRLKSYESLKKRKLGNCSVSFVRDSTICVTYMLHI